MAWHQAAALVGERGLLPIRHFLDRVEAALGSGWPSLRAAPTLFWLGASDGALRIASGVGIALAAAALVGLGNAPVFFALWVLQLSFVNAGQLFWGYGWETLLAEAGFLAVFLAPGLRPGELRPDSPPSRAVIWLARWLLFRVMFGAGLIKIRGDECWRDLTCLHHHYETQPLPNPLSWLLHQTPGWFHKIEVLWNHLVELVIPFGLFGPRRVRTVAGLVTAAFQVTLILSGNLSWLNYLTLILCLACLDDRTVGRIFPLRVRARAETLGTPPPSRRRRIATGAYVVLVAVLSIRPTVNLLSRDQAMNASFEPLHLVNTYGAFGSVGDVRSEVILEGTEDDPLIPGARWLAYELPCKPGAPTRRPCFVAPYQPRLDWQLWFAAMSSAASEPWLVHLVWKLLNADPGALSLMATDPFAGRRPRAVRADLYEYRLTRFGGGSDAWWEHSRVGGYLPALSADDAELRRWLSTRRWLDPAAR